MAGKTRYGIVLSDLEQRREGSVFSGTEAYWTATALGAENSLSMPPDSVVTAVFEK